MSDIENTLNNLSPEEIAVLKTLVSKLASTDAKEPTDEQPEKETKRRKQRRFPKSKGVKQQKNRPVNNRHNQPKPRKDKVDMYDVDEEDEDDSPEEELTRRLNRVKGRKPNPNQGKKSKLCSTQRIDLTGENKFLKMSDRFGAKNDIEIDRKLSGKNKPTERGETRLIQVRCQGCRKKKMVSPIMLKNDEDTGDIVYTCDDCLGNRRGR